MAARHLALLCALPIFAYDCAHISLCDRLTRYPVAFLGETIEIKNSLARLRVIENYKGLLPGTTEQLIRLTEYTNLYQPGAQTFVFTQSDLTDGVCSASLLAARHPGLGEQIRRDLANPPRGRLTGDVFSGHVGRIPVPGAEVKIEGSNANRVIRANESGHFEVHILPAGAYTIRATAPGHQEFLSYLRFDGACDDQTFPLPANTHVSGRLVQPDGRPVPGVLVFLRDDDTFSQADKTARDGSFEFINVAPGDYHLRTDQYTYPAPIILRAQRDITGLEVLIPNLGPTRIIDVEVTAANGTPAAEIEVNISEPELPYLTRLITDKNGRAAYLDRPGKKHTLSIRATPYLESQVPAGTADVTVRFQLGEPRKSPD